MGAKISTRFIMNFATKSSLSMRLESHILAFFVTEKKVINS